MDEKGFLIGVLRKMRRVYSKEAFQKGNIIAAGQDGNRVWITVGNKGKWPLFEASSREVSCRHVPRRH